MHEIKQSIIYSLVFKRTIKTEEEKDRIRCIRPTTPPCWLEDYYLLFLYFLLFFFLLLLLLLYY